MSKLRSFFLFMAAAAVLAGIHTPAMAYQAEATRLQRHAVRSDAGEVFDRWAQCVADLDVSWARSLLATLPTSKAESDHFARREDLNDRCLVDDELLMHGKGLYFSSESARGRLARYLVRKQIDGQDRRPAPGSGMAWLRDTLTVDPEGAQYNRSVLIGHQFALCMADEHWAETRAFVLAEPDSAGERTALAALSPKFASCMTSGAKLELTRPILRVLLSEAAFHALNYVPKVAAQ